MYQSRIILAVPLHPSLTLLVQHVECRCTQFWKVLEGCLLLIWSPLGSCTCGDERGSWLRILTSQSGGGGGRGLPERSADIGEPVLGRALAQRHTCLLHLARQRDGPWLPGPGPGLRLPALEACQEGRVLEGRRLQPWVLRPLRRVARDPDGQPCKVPAKSKA